MTITAKLLPGLTFDNFVQDDSNLVAFTAAVQCAEQPGKAHSPLLIYGATGLGKTHLVHAIAHAIKSRQPDANILVLNSERFVSEMIAALREGRIEAFRSDLRRAAAIMIEEVQFLAGKDRSQMELRECFDALQAEGRQLVFTCNAYPQDLKQLDEKLASRLSSHLVAGIGPPGFAARLAILQQRARASGADVDTEVLRLVAERITTNARDLQGTLATLLAWSRFREQRLSMNFTAEILDELLPRPRA